MRMAGGCEKEPDTVFTSIFGAQLSVDANSRETVTMSELIKEVRDMGILEGVSDSDVSNFALFVIVEADNYHVIEINEVTLSVTEKGRQSQGTVDNTKVVIGLAAQMLQTLFRRESNAPSSSWSDNGDGLSSPTESQCGPDELGQQSDCQ